jgi:hypothetical protein
VIEMPPRLRPSKFVSSLPLGIAFTLAFGGVASAQAAPSASPSAAPSSSAAAASAPASSATPAGGSSATPAPAPGAKPEPKWMQKIRAQQAARAALIAAREAAKKPAGAAAKPAKPPSLGDVLKGPARAEWELARQLYEDGDYKNAGVKYQHAYDLSSDARLLWNVAACEKNQRHYARALDALERYMKEGGALLTPEDVQEANATKGALSGLVGTLKLTANEDGADVCSTARSSARRRSRGRCASTSARASSA